uniref:Glyoxalase/fosfomycin resistance/dioxygenase domain-containing protein n=2 Tax=Lotharella globosa TaxID=91324 RepID=A0A7S3Z592_9EUKA
MTDKDVKDIGKAERPQKIFANMWFDGNCAEALKFYVKAFECKQIFCMAHEGCVVHACIQFHNKDNMIFLSDVHGDHFETGANKAGASISLMVYVKDVDEAYKRAKDAGCTMLQEPEDQFWGDRIIRLKGGPVFLKV